MHALPGSTYVGDIHCVTTWSKFDMTFAGVSVDTLLEAARPTAEARFVMAHSTTGYTTNLPLADVTGGKAWVVWEVDGKPLPRARRPGAAAGAAPVLLEVREVDHPARADGARPARASGSRTATTTAATPGSSSATRVTRERRAPAGGWTHRHGSSSSSTPTDRLVRLRFHVEDRVDHLPGQHYVVRLRRPTATRRSAPTRSRPTPTTRCWS